MGINTVRLYICHHQIAGTSSGGGDIGKKINHGGGDVDGNEDDYFDDGDEGDGGGLFRRQTFLEELFGHKFVDAVLNEWQRTMMDLPAGFQKAYDMKISRLNTPDFDGLVVTWKA